jgi:cyclopropane fatty-acyl-phospholipid synthase-like methyltransferase
MLEFGSVKKGDIVYDLGSGDGRVVILAAKHYGVNGVGIEMDSGLVETARAEAK